MKKFHSQNKMRIIIITAEMMLMLIGIHKKFIVGKTSFLPTTKTQFLEPRKTDLVTISNHRRNFTAKKRINIFNSQKIYYLTKQA